MIILENGITLELGQEYKITLHDENIGSRFTFVGTGIATKGIDNDVYQTMIFVGYQGRFGKLQLTESDIKHIVRL